MMIFRTALVAVCAVAGPAGAQVFTDRVEFEHAVGSVTIETFEDEPLSPMPGGPTVSRSFDNFWIDTVPAAAKVVDRPFSGSYNTTPGGKNYLYLDTDRGRIGSRTTVTFAEPVTAFGFDYTGMGELDNRFTVEIGGSLFRVHRGSEVVDGFWGYIGAATATVVLETTTDSGYGVDQVTMSSDSCPADCDGSGDLSFFDFLCFQNAFAAGDPGADCDHSGELDFFDLLCFQSRFAEGCA